MSLLATRGSYSITTDIAAMDVDRVHGWLSTDAYWSQVIPLGTVKRSFENSLAFHLLHTNDGQVGVARMITDRATFAYLADVYIAREHRGSGLGHWLMEVITSHPHLQGLRRQMLATRDMHQLYEKFGFTALSEPDILMEKRDPDIYRRMNVVAKN